MISRCIVLDDAASEVNAITDWCTFASSDKSDSGYRFSTLMTFFTPHVHSGFSAPCSSLRLWVSFRFQLLLITVQSSYILSQPGETAVPGHGFISALAASARWTHTHTPNLLLYIISLLHGHLLCRLESFTPRPRRTRHVVYFLPVLCCQDIIPISFTRELSFNLSWYFNIHTGFFFVLT